MDTKSALRRSLTLIGLGLTSFALIGASPLAAAHAQGRLNLRWMQQAAYPTNFSLYSQNCVAYSPSGHFVAAASADGTVRILRASDGFPLRFLTGHTSSVNSIAFSSDGQTLASGGSDGKVRFWRIADGKPLTDLTLNDPDGGVICIAFSADGLYLAGGSSKTVRIWRVSSGANTQILTGHADSVTAVAFSPNGLSIATASTDHLLKLWDTGNGSNTKTFTGHASRVTSVAFAPDGGSIVSGSADKTVKRWSVASGAVLNTISGHTGVVNSVAFSKDGGRIVSASSDDLVKVWPTTGGASLQTLTGHTADVLSAAFSPDGLDIVSGGVDGAIKLWTVADGTEIPERYAKTSGANAVAYSPNGQTIATGSSDNSVKLWKSSDGSLIKTLMGHTGSVNAVAFSIDGLTLASGSSDKTVKLWRISDGQTLYTLTKHLSAVTSVAFSSDRQTLASGGAQEDIQGNDTGAPVKFWRLSDGFNLSEVRQEAGGISSIAFSPDGTLLASGSEESNGGALNIWKVSNRTNLKTLGNCSRVAFSPDGKMLVGTNRNSSVVFANLKLWNVSDWTVRQTLTGHTADVHSIAFSPDGLTFASGSQDGTIKLWRTSDGQLLRTDQDERLGKDQRSGGVTGVSFSPNGRFIAFCSYLGAGLINSPSVQSTVLLQNSTDGSAFYWKTLNASIGSADYLWKGGDKNWKIVGTPDLDGDGVPDVLLQYAGTGRLFGWMLNSSQTVILANGDLTYGGSVLGSAYAGWRVAATPDLNHDGKSDIVLQNPSTGAVEYLLMDGLKVTAKGSLWAGGNKGYRLISMPDLNGDGVPDALFQYAPTGSILQWTLDSSGTSIASTSYVWSAALPGWNAITAKDLNGDGSVKLILQNVGDGSVYEWNLIGSTLDAAGTGALYAGKLPGWSVKGLTDLTGDGKADLVMQNTTDGHVYWWGLDGLGIASQGVLYGNPLPQWLVVSPSP